MNAEELVALAEQLDRDNPIRPENRGRAKLQLSGFLPRGQVYRLHSDESRRAGARPIIVMHPEDALLLAAELHPLSRERWEQEIADIVEETFARQRDAGDIADKLLNGYREAAQHIIKPPPPATS